MVLELLSSLHAGFLELSTVSHEEQGTGLSWRFLSFGFVEFLLAADRFILPVFQSVEVNIILNSVIMLIFIAMFVSKGLNGRS